MTIPQSNMLWFTINIAYNNRDSGIVMVVFIPSSNGLRMRQVKLHIQFRKKSMVLWNTMYYYYFLFVHIKSGIYHIIISIHKKEDDFSTKLFCSSINLQFAQCWIYTWHVATCRSDVAILPYRWSADLIFF